MAPAKVLASMGASLSRGPVRPPGAMGARTIGMRQAAQPADPAEWVQSIDDREWFYRDGCQPRYDRKSRTSREVILDSWGIPGSDWELPLKLTGAQPLRRLPSREAVGVYHLADRPALGRRGSRRGRGRQAPLL